MQWPRHATHQGNFTGQLNGIPIHPAHFDHAAHPDKSGGR
jgi:hypothetical protein